MPIQYVDPDEMVHPLRLELSEEEMASVIQGIIDDENWMSLDEIEAAQDRIYDHIAAARQTHDGVTTLQ